MSRIPTADKISILRALLTVLLIAFSLFGMWDYALIYFIIAWLTDVIDGPIAREHGSWRDSRPGLDMDGICDTALAFGSSLVVVVYAWFNYSPEVSWLLTGLYALTAVSGITMALIMNRPSKKPWMVRLIAFNMIALHGAVQIFGTGAWFAAMAIGPIGVVITAATAISVAWSQRHKMRLWMAGKFA